jgi:hypothetical protein
MGERCNHCAINQFIITFFNFSGSAFQTEIEGVNKAKALPGQKALQRYRHQNRA